MRPVQQYYIQPPNLPAYLYRNTTQAWIDLMVWSYREYKERLRRLGKDGHFLELKHQSDEYSPIRVLAEMTGFRLLCAKMNSFVWKELTRQQRKYLLNAFEMRDFLLRDSGG